jgi:thymidylate kinase
MLTISKELFTAWNNAKIMYCHWKSNEHLLPGLDGETDLDVLLSRDDKKEGESILRQLEFLQVRSQFGSRYPNVDDWIGFDKETGTLIHIHLHYRIVTGHKGMKEYSLPWTELALRTRILDEEYGVYIMEPNLEIITLYTRIGLKSDFKNIIRCRRGTFRFPKDTQREIDWLKARVNKEQTLQLLDTFYGEKAKAMFSIMEKESIAAKDFLQLRKITEQQFKEYSRVKSFMRLKEVLFYLYQKWGKRFALKFQPIITKKVPISGKGVSIAFIGQDGCGKSTVTMAIQKWFNWKIDARRFYLGSGDHYNSLLKRLLKKGVAIKNSPHNSGIKNNEVKTGKTSRKQKKNLKTLIQAVMVSLNMLNVARRAYNVVKQSEKYRNKGGIALFDRFPQLQFEGIYDGPKIENYYQERGLDFAIVKWMSKKEKQYIRSIQNYQPKLVFKLLLPPEESIRRKPFENLQAVTRKHEITKELHFEISNVIVVDATQDYQQELVFIKNQIWRELINVQL